MSEDAAPSGPSDDFPADPILDAPAGSAAAPKSAPKLFGAAGDAAGGPCVAEPEDGSLFPRNFLRPRFRFIAPAGHNLFEIRLRTEAEKHELVVYTTSTTFVLPAEIWRGLSLNAIDKPITFSVRSAQYDAASDTLKGGPYKGGSGTMTIAPAEASGSIVYWMLKSGASALKGFAVGDETVKDVLDPTKIAGSKCVGCHASTPDGKNVAMSSSTNGIDGGSPSSIAIRTLADTTQSPAFLTESAKTMLARTNQHAVAFSRGHWAAGDRLMLSTLNVLGKSQLVWTDLEATSADQGKGWDVLPRTGDLNAAGGAAWSHDGKTVVYMSSTIGIAAGVVDAVGQSDLFAVPFGDKKGGAATPLVKDPATTAYYPQLSADDALVAYSRVPRGQTTYNNPKAEVMVVPLAGGTPTRLKANDGGKCEGGASPGITNSWPKWSPFATASGSKTYYWLTFSSTRAGGKPQLYVAPVVVSGSSVESYPALYLWNQPAGEGNHTPAWDVFALSVK